MPPELENDSRASLIAGLSRQSRMAAIWTTVGVLAVLLSLVWSYNTIRSADQRLHTIDRQIKERQLELDGLNHQIAELTAQKDAQLAVTNGLLQREGANATKALNAVVEANPEIARSIPRVYLQIGREEQRAGAKQTLDPIRSAGFTVPGDEIELVGASKAPRQVTQVRYFYPLRDSSVDLNKLLAALNSVGVKAEAKFVKMRSGVNPPPPRMYEIWFSLSEFGTQPVGEVR